MSEHDFDIEAFFSENYFDFREHMLALSKQDLDPSMLKGTIYVPSKGRSTKSFTVNNLVQCGISNYKIVVDQNEYEAYATTFGDDHVIALPDSNRGIAFSRNFIKSYSKSKGEEHHFQIDDDIKYFYRREGEIRNIRTNALLALVSLESIYEKFSNVAIAGVSANVFAKRRPNAISQNQLACVCIIVKNDTPYEWKPGVREDLDYSMQVLKAGECTFITNDVTTEAVPPGYQGGGNGDNIYKDENLIKMFEQTHALHSDHYSIKPIDKGLGLRLFPKFHTYKKFPQRMIKKP